MKLIKVTSTMVDGFEGNEIDTESYILCNEDNIPNNETPYTRDDVVEEDVVFLTYNTYEEVGDINEGEVEVLRKFKIIL